MKFKKIELASTKKTDKYDELAAEFLKKIFGIKNFLITDESSIYDFDFEFVGKIHNTEKVLKKIKKNYGVEVSKIKGLKLHKIFQMILKQRH